MCVFGDNINPQQLLRNSNDGDGKCKLPRGYLYANVYSP